MKTFATWLALCSLPVLTMAAAAQTPPAGSEAPRAVAPAPAGKDGPGKERKRGPTMDSLELGATTITGNRELPKVMYVVPWKRADIGDLGGKPLRSLVDEVLEPVDREVFGRENSYFRALEPAREGEVETPVTAGQGKP